MDSQGNRFLDYVISKAKERQKTIAFDEIEDDRLMQAVKKILHEKIAKVILVGEEKTLMQRVSDFGLNDPNLSLAIMSDSDKKMLAERLYDIRKEKLTSLDDALELMNDPIYFSTMLVNEGMADGLISGACHSTAHTIKPALQIIKTRPPISTVSGLFFMLIPDGRMYLFADCAVLPNPDPRQLAEIAVASSRTAKSFGIDPKVAMLSFSTKGSAKHEMIDKVTQALHIAKDLNPDLVIDGELQVDAAIVPEVARRKVKTESAVAGAANVLIFPDLNSGNIGYKLVERFGNAIAIGPILQGLKKPVNDLSRGCNVDDIFYLTAITSLQS